MTGTPRSTPESPRAEWILLLHLAWQRRADEGHRLALSALERAGIAVHVIEAPRVEDAPPTARRPHAVLAVAPSKYLAAAKTLRAAGWKQSLIDRIILLLRTSIRLRSESLDIVLLRAGSTWIAKAPIDFRWILNWLQPLVHFRPPGLFTLSGVHLLAIPGVYKPARKLAEILALALDQLKDTRSPVVVDVGTGAGAFALGIASERNDATAFGFDISRAAVWNSRMNARRLRLRNVTFSQGAMLSALPPEQRGRVNLIVAHLPFMPPAMRMEIDGASSWRGPGWTIQGTDADGLGLYRRLATAAEAALVPGGAIIFQLGEWQGHLLAAELSKGGYAAQEIAAGVVLARWRGR